MSVGEPLATVGAKDGDGDGASVVGKRDGKKLHGSHVIEAIHEALAIAPLL